jgi:hypothetical protein
MSCPATKLVQVRGLIAGGGGRALVFVAARWQQDRAPQAAGPLLGFGPPAGIDAFLGDDVADAQAAAGGRRTRKPRPGPLSLFRWRWPVAGGRDAISVRRKPAGETSARRPMLPPVRAATMGKMEIRIILDRAEPPAGRLRAVPDPGQCRAGQDEEIRFTGWLGLLRALYEVTGGPGAGSVPVP